MSKNKSSCTLKKTSIGGQALMEGIMMRGPETTAMAVRNTKGEIVVEKFPTETKKRAKFFKLPFVRGVFNYIDSMTMGTKCLMRSAEISGLEDAEQDYKLEKQAKKAAKANGTSMEEELAKLKDKANESNEEDSIKDESKKAKKDSSAMMNTVMFFSVLMGIAFSVLLFIVVPSYLYKLLTFALPVLKFEDNLALQSLVKSVFEGILKIAILVGYMALVSLMKDIRRTFMFHGAEHKTIFCYESGLELTVENVRKQNKFHPRCGTSFLILMLLVGIFVSFFIDPLFLAIFGYLPQTIIRVLIKLALLPIIVGVGYELIKVAGRHDNLFTRIISAPGVWLQHVTVLEPTDDMIECAILAVNEVIPEDGSDLI
jgi:uncharacterized protein YqhQ